MNKICKSLFKIKIHRSQLALLWPCRNRMETTIRTCTSGNPLMIREIRLIIKIRQSWVSQEKEGLRIQYREGMRRAKASLKHI